MVRLRNWSCFSCWGDGERNILSLPAQVGRDLVFWVGLWGLHFWCRFFLLIRLSLSLLHMLLGIRFGVLVFVTAISGCSKNIIFGILFFSFLILWTSLFLETSKLLGGFFLFFSWVISDSVGKALGCFTNFGGFWSPGLAMFFVKTRCGIQVLLFHLC